MGQSKPIWMDLSEAAQKRHDMFLNSYERLRHFAFRAQKAYELDNKKAVVVCIMVDSIWRDLVDIIMPDVDWQIIRDQGVEPIAQGFQKSSICELIAERMPNLAKDIFSIPQEGHYKCLVLDEGGCTIYEIEPKEQK